MKINKRQQGSEAENLALQKLQNSGMRLLEQNYRVRAGEIDLIMEEQGCIVFVEVRSKTLSDFGTPVETVNYKKRRQIEKIAKHYLKHKKVSEDVLCRFDIVGITKDEKGCPEIEHIRHAFVCGE